MKLCPLCGSTYHRKVEFCFQDGTPLCEASSQLQAIPSKQSAVLVAPVEPAGDIASQPTHQDAPEPANLRPTHAHRAPTRNTRYVFRALDYSNYFGPDYSNQFVSAGRSGPRPGPGP